MHVAVKSKKFVLKLLYFSFLFLPLAYSTKAEAKYTAEEKPMNLCFFSLNSLKDFAAIRNILKNMDSIRVKEWLEVGGYPQQSFMQLLESGEKCDGLVISGHHRSQGFDGQRSHNFLSIEQLERWSCDPQWNTWFQHVKVLWLQGCATSRRQNEDDMSFAHRYAKVFPNAALFAWSGSAPLKSSYLTIPYQFVNLKKILHEKDMKKALIDLLKGKHIGEALLAWKKLRNRSSRKYFGIWNHTAQAFYPHFNSRKNIEIHESTCSLLNPSPTKKRFFDIQKILSSKPKLMANLDFLLQELKSSEKKPETYLLYQKELKEILAKSILYKKILLKTIYNKKYSPLKKVRLYRLHLYAGNKSNKDWEETIKTELLRALNNPFQYYDRVELKQYNNRLILSLIEKLPNNKYLFKSEDFMKIKQPKALSAMLRIIGMISHSKKTRLLYALSNNPHMEGEHLHKLAWLLRLNNVWGRNKIFNKILSNPKTASKTVSLLKERPN